MPAPAVVVVVVVLVKVMAVNVEIRAASPPCESTMVVTQELSGSGGNRTLVMIPGTTSAKYRETKVIIYPLIPTSSKTIY